MNSSTKNGPRINGARGPSDSTPKAKESPVRPQPSKRERRLTERERSRLAQAQASSAAPPKSPESAESDAAEESPQRARRSYPSWLVSLLVHAVLLVALGLFTLTSPLKDELVGLVVSPSGPETSLDELEELTEVEMEVAPEAPAVESSAPAMAQMLADSFQVAAPTADIDAINGAVAADFSGAPEIGAPDMGAEISKLTGGGAVGELFGAKTRGQVAVVFDVSASMYGSVPLVVRELKSKFADAQVVAVHGVSFRRYSSELRLTPYAENEQLYKDMYKNTLKRSKKNLPLLKVMHQELLSLSHCDSLPTDGGQSVGAALEILMRQPGKRPGTIFVFADFMDKVDPAYLQEIAQLAARQRIRIVLYHPVKFSKHLAEYQMFIKIAKGEIREGLAK